MAGKRTIVVDSDPITTSMFAVLFVLAVGVVVSGIWELIHGVFPIRSVNRNTYLSAGVGMFGLYGFKSSRALQFASGLMLLGASVRLVLQWMGASGDAQKLAAAGLTLLSILVFVAFTVFFIQYFRARVRVVCESDEAAE